MELNIFDRHLVHSLYSSVEENITLYETGNFDELLKNQALHIRTVPGVFIDESIFSQFETKSGGTNDAKNAYILYNGFTNFTPYLAVDERIWVTLCHQHAKEFVTKRWLKSYQTKEEKVAAVKLHLFARHNRAFVKTNALASLWWWAHVVCRTKPKNEAKTIELFCKYTDLRDQVFDRTSTSRGEKTFPAILKCMEKKYKEDPDTRFFSRKKSKGDDVGPYREWLKVINRYGGRVFMDSLTVKELTDVYYSFLKDIEQSKGAP